MRPTSIKRLQNILQGDGTKISRETIADYMGYLHDAYLTFTISNYTDSLSERSTIGKHYFYDNGLLSLFITQPETKLLENLVALHLYKKYGDKLQYYNRNVEVDFIVNSKHLLVQVAWSITDESTRQRETEALVKAATFFGYNEAYIVTFNEEETITMDSLTIHAIPLFKLLLE